mgnify:CR=1 FL=1
MEKLRKEWEKNREQKSTDNYAVITQWKQYNAQEIDEVAQKAHNTVFEHEVDCLACGNCCKVLQPYFTNKDIARIAAHFGQTASDFALQYLEVNNFNEFRMRSKPCAFLNPDNTCAIYAIRPQNCSEYPHTNKKNFTAQRAMHADNTIVCMATYAILERMKKAIQIKD